MCGPLTNVLLCNRLKAEKKKWQSLKNQTPPELPPLFPPPPAASSSQEGDSSHQQQSLQQQQQRQQLPLPDASLLDAEEARMLEFITESTGALSLLGPQTQAQGQTTQAQQTQARLRALQETLEFRIDRLADGVHKAERRTATAGRQADLVLSLGAARLRERERREKAAAGTRDMPVMEVLRSLGRILPEGGGG